MPRLNKRPPESVFRMDRTLSTGEISGGTVIPLPNTDAYSPYAERWKEFAKLERQVKGGTFESAIWMIWSVILPMIGVLNLHHFSHKENLSLFGSGAVLGLVGLARREVAKKRFAHWPCPRCGAEWTGTKTKKEPKCAICGLKLHQLAP